MTNNANDVLIEALIVRGLNATTASDDPKAAIQALIAWEISVALDPRVSDKAQNLYQEGYNEGKKVGYDEGHQEGYDSGYDDGREEGPQCCCDEEYEN